MILLFIKMFSGAGNLTIAPTALGGSGGNATGLGDPQASTLPTIHTDQSTYAEQLNNAQMDVIDSGALNHNKYDGPVENNATSPGWMQRLKNRFFGYDNKNTAMQVYKPEGTEPEESGDFESATDNNDGIGTLHGHVVHSPYVREVGGTYYYTNLIDSQVKSDRTFAFVFNAPQVVSNLEYTNQTTGENDQFYEEPSGDSGFAYFTSWLEALKPFINENNKQLANVLFGASGVAAVISSSSTIKYQWQLRRAKAFYDGEKPLPKDKDEQEKLYRDALAFFDEIIEKISKDLATETVNADTAATSDDPSATPENGSTVQTDASPPVNQTTAFFTLAKEILNHFEAARKAIEDDQLVTPEIIKNVFDNIHNQCEKIINDVEKTITDFMTNNEKSEDDSEMNLSKAKNFVEQTANFIISTATIESAKKDKIEYLHFIFIIFGLRFKEQTKKCIENPAGLKKEIEHNVDEEKGAGTKSTPEVPLKGPENTPEQPATFGTGESGSSEVLGLQGAGTSTETGSTVEQPATFGTGESGTSGTSGTVGTQNTLGNTSNPGTTSAQTGTLGTKKPPVPKQPLSEGIGSSAASGSPGTVGNPTSSTVTQGQYQSGASTAQTQNPVQQSPFVTPASSAGGKLTPGDEQPSSTPLDGSGQPLTAQHSGSQPSATPSQTVSGSQPLHKDGEETPTSKPSGKIQGKGDDQVAPAGAGSTSPSDDGNKPSTEPQNATPKNVKKGVNPWVIGGLCLVGVIAVAAAAYFAMTMLKE